MQACAEELEEEAEGGWEVFGLVLGVSLLVARLGDIHEADGGVRSLDFGHVFVAGRVEESGRVKEELELGSVGHGDGRRVGGG